MPKNAKTPCGYGLIRVKINSEGIAVNHIDTPVVFHKDFAILEQWAASTAQHKQPVPVGLLVLHLHNDADTQGIRHVDMPCAAMVVAVAVRVVGGKDRTRLFADGRMSPTVLAKIISFSSR